MAKKKRSRRRPNREQMRGSVQHSYDHRGETGMYGNIYKGEVSEWYPANDEHELVIIPYQVGSNENSSFRNKWNRPFSKEEIKDGECWDYKLTIMVHGNVGPNKDNVLCLGTFDEPCPRCEEVAALREKKDKLEDDGKSTKEIDELIGSLAKRKRALYNVVILNDKKENKKGVQLWQAPHQSIEDTLTERARNKKTGEIIPYGFPEEGYSIWFEKEGSGLATKYTGVSLEESGVKEDDLDEWYEQAYDLEDIIEVLSYDEFYKKCYGSSPGEDAEEEEEVDIEEEEEERPRGRGRKRRYNEEDAEEEEDAAEKEDDDGDAEEEEEEPRRRGRRSVREKRIIEENDDNEDPPECFGVEFGALEACEDCPDDIYKDCMKAHKELGKKKRRRRK